MVEFTKKESNYLELQGWRYEKMENMVNWMKKCNEEEYYPLLRTLATVGDKKIIETNWNENV